MSCGYKEDNTAEDRIKGLAGIGDLDAVELCYNPDGDANDEVDGKKIKAVCDKYKIKASGVNAPLNGNRMFEFGSLTNTDPSVRAKAIQWCKDTCDFARETSAEFVNIWMGEDGFDYSFQTDYTNQWNLMVDAIQQICDYAPDLKIALEFKLREPRNRCTLDTAGSTLLLAKDVNRKNVGLTVDLGHVFQAGENIAQVIEMCANHNMLYNIHVNDNYGSWDDDMMVGSVRYVEFIELCYSLRKVDYKGYVSVDIFPFREDAFRATEESVEMMKIFDADVDKIGADNIRKCIEGSDATAIYKLIREKVFTK